MNESKLIFKVKRANQMLTYKKRRASNWMVKKALPKKWKEEKKTTTVKLNEFQLTSLEKIQFHHFIVEL